MPIIKLDAIDSTNDYLKLLAKETELENYTIVIANEQTKGKGQMGANWISEPGKNLTMSILIKEVQINYQNIFNLNIVMSLAIMKVLFMMNIPNIKIKWPNDIMAGTKKLAGILIENTIKSDGSINVIVGIGFNLNQTNFKNLPQASSLRYITGKTYDIEQMAMFFATSIKLHMTALSVDPKNLWKLYHEALYKKNYPSPFKDKQGNCFMGVIKKVTPDGKLEVLLNDGSEKHFEVKEIKMLH
jgi:BirA family biotin operon repressor/biotin-[acetyl-CoA-carboxylase] ligase